MSELEYKIEEIVKKDVETILSDAKKNAENIVALARREAEKRRRKALEEKEEYLKTIRKQEMAKARRAGRLKILEARDKMIELAFNEAFKKIESLKTSDKYLDLLEKLILKSADILEENELIVESDGESLKILKPRLKEITNRISKELKDSVTINLKEKDIKGGVIVSTLDGRKRYDASLEGRLARLRDEIRFKIAEKLFGGEIKIEI